MSNDAAFTTFVISFIMLAFCLVELHNLEKKIDNHIKEELSKKKNKFEDISLDTSCLSISEKIEFKKLVDKYKASLTQMDAEHLAFNQIMNRRKDQ